MFVLDWPWALAALPLPLLARWLPAAHPRLGKALRLPFYAELAGLEAGRRGGSGRPCAMPWPGPCWCWPPPDTNGWGSR